MANVGGIGVPVLVHNPVTKEGSTFYIHSYMYYNIALFPGFPPGTSCELCLLLTW